MRISLVEREAERRRQQRRKKRKRSRRFETAVAQPQIQARPRPRPRRGAKERSRRPPAQPRPRTAQPAVEMPGVRTGLGWRLILIRLPALVGLAGLIGLIVYASTDAQFFVYKARVAGARHIEATTIYHQAGVDEQNIFWIDPEQVAERIRQIDGIKAARVRCNLPAQVFIEVEEREPVVMWRVLAQQRDWWLDDEGRVLPYPGDAQSPEMIFVVDSSERQLAPGGSLQPASLVQSVKQLAAALPGTRIFFYDAERQLSFQQQVADAQWPVYIGTSDDLARKIQVLQLLTRHLSDQQIRPRYVDVRWADHPAYGVVGNAAVEEGE